MRRIWQLRSIMAGNYQSASRSKPAYLFSFFIIQNLYVGKYQSPAMKIRERARRDDLKLQMFLQQKNQYALVRLQKFFSKIVPSGGREVHTNRIDWLTRTVKGFFVLFDPTEYFAPGRFVIRSRHHVALRIPEVRARYNLRHGQVLHRLRGSNVFVAIPRIIQNPGGFFLGKGTERMN